MLGEIVQQKPFDPAGYILHQDEGVDLLPANIDLAMVEMNLVGVMGRETVLRELLETMRGQYDYILLDCCPSLGALTANALTAANEVIIPMLAHCPLRAWSSFYPPSGWCGANSIPACKSPASLSPWRICAPLIPGTL